MIDMISIPDDGGEKVQCPRTDQEGNLCCPMMLGSSRQARDHYQRRHENHAIFVIQDMEFYPKCTRCHAQYKHSTGFVKHRESQRCAQFTERVRKATQEQTRLEAYAFQFSLGGEHIERVPSFTYLGRVLQENDQDEEAIRARIRLATTAWRNISRVLHREGADIKVKSTFYRTIIQAVLLYGSESWTLTRTYRKMVDRFHKSAARRMAGVYPIEITEGEWTWPRSATYFKTCNLQTATDYICKRQATTRSWMEENRSIWMRALEEEAHLNKVQGTQVRTYWWDQSNIQAMEEGDSDEEDPDSE